MWICLPFSRALAPLMRLVGPGALAFGVLLSVGGAALDAQEVSLPPILGVPEQDSTAAVSVPVFVDWSAGGSQDVVIDWETVAIAGGATPGEDFQVRSGTMIVPPLTSQKNLTFFVFGDLMPEPDEKVGIQLTVVSGGFPSTVYGEHEIQNDDRVEVFVSSNPVTETDGQARFDVFFSPTPTPVALLLDWRTFEVAGGASPDVDFQHFPATQDLSVPAGMSTAEIFVPIFDDSEPEPPEDFKVWVSSTDPSVDVVQPWANATIDDDDGAPSTATLSVHPATGYEGTVLQIPVTLSEPVPFDVEFSISGYLDTGVYPQPTTFVDYSPPPSPTHLIPAGNTAWEIEIPILDDGQVEPTEAFELVVVSSDVIVDNGSALILIEDSTPLPSVDIGDLSTLEGPAGANTVFAFPVTFSSAPSGTVTIQYRTVTSSGPGHADGSDLNLVANGFRTVSNPGLQTTLPITAWGDDAWEPDEIFWVEIVDVSSNLQLGSRTTAVGTLENDDFPTVDVIGDQVSEGGPGDVTPLLFELRLPAPPLNPVPVRYRTAHGTTDSADLVAVAETTIQMTNQSHFVEVDVLGDSVSEGDEEFRLEIVPGAGTAAGGSAIGRILDDDAVLTQPQVSVEDQQLFEGDSGSQFLQFRLVRQGGSTAAFQVDYATRAGTATPDSGAADPSSDYVEASGTALFAADQNEAWVDVEILGDTRVEDDETLYLDLANASGATIGDGTGLGVIGNDDVAAPRPTAELLGPSAIDELDSPHGVVYKVRLSAEVPPDGAPVVVRHEARGLSATAGDDFVEITGTELTFQPGEVEKTFVVQVLGDTVVETDESLRVRIGPFDGADPGAITEIELRLRDDDDPNAPPRVLLDEISVVEGHTGVAMAQVPIRLSEDPPSPVTVAWSTQDGEAIAGLDYQSAGGDVSLTGTSGAVLEIPVMGDLDVESSEDFLVVLEPPTNALLDVASARVIIVDDDEPAPAPGQTILRLADARAQEGDAGSLDAVLTAELIGDPPSGDVSVDFATVDGSATVADSDYQARSGSLTFPEGVTTLSFGVRIEGDTRAEGDESFFVELSNVQGAQLASPRAEVVIVDDDGGGSGTGSGGLAMLSLDAPERVREASRRLAVRVVLDRPSSRGVRARVRAVGETATAGEDFEARVAELEWSPGQSGERTVRIPITSDGRAEGPERLRLLLETLDPAAAGVALESVVVTIVDDDRAVSLEAEETSLVGKTGETVVAQVRALDAEGLPIEGAIVVWSSTELDVEEPEIRTDQDGLARNEIRLGERPGVVRLEARLADAAEDQTAARVVFEITVQGSLSDLFDDDRRPNESSIAGVLDGACVAPEDEMREVCDYVYSLPPEQQGQAVQAIAPNDVVVRGDVALRSQKVQMRNISARQAQLRGGASQAPLDSLAFEIQGRGVTVGQFLSVSEYRDSRAELGEKVDAQLARLEADAGIAMAEDRASTAEGEGESEQESLGEDRTIEEQHDRPFGFFVNGRITVGEHDRTTVEPGYDVETRGLTAGVDYRIGKRSWIGLAAGYLDSATDVDGRHDALDTSGYSLSVYGGHQRGPFWVDGAFSYGWLDFDAVREIRLPVAFQGSTLLEARSTSSSSQALLNASLGYDLQLGRVAATGFARGLWAEAEIDGYSERDVGGFALSFADQTVDSGLLEAGVELGTPFSFSWGVVHPMARVSWLHELADDMRDVAGGFAFDVTGDQFRLRTDRPDRDYLRAGLGAQFTLPGTRLLYLMAERDFSRDDYRETTWSFGYRQQW